MCDDPQKMIEMMDLMDDLSFMFPDELENVTRCRRPCQYYVYNLAEPIQEGDSPNSTQVSFSLASKDIISKKEVYLYSFSSLVAEFGGSLGLFVGFSFLMLWDVAENSTFIILRWFKSDKEFLK